ncbi:putative tolloid-like protein 2 [Apostichopus japonicus]|uniref:Putative tolloid-like protein 2 n=1 Tax=Stichopus japonicus TaxID=307972 RepID=A0A2G8JTE0_STIJA|nr:putative tolloid-like protein 2 [Apostichopus japonicus]
MMINSFHHTIKFTAEFSGHNVHFLDTTVTLQNGSPEQTCAINPRTSTTTFYQAVAIHVTVPEIFRKLKRCAFDAFAPLKSILIPTPNNYMSQHILNRQYFLGTIENAIKTAKSKSRTETLTFLAILMTFCWQVPPSMSACNITISTNGGNITSPNYPDEYGSHVTCWYLVIAPDLTTVTLSFSSFKVEAGSSLFGGRCRYDSLSVSSRISINGFMIQIAIVRVT